MKDHHLIACHECDLLHRIQSLPKGGAAKCTRCGAVLFAHKPDSLNRTIAFSIAGLILLILTNAYPLLVLKKEGLFQDVTLIQGVVELYRQKMYGLSGLVALTCVLVPAFQLTGLLYVLLPLKFNRAAWMASHVFRLVRKMQPWGMMEVFMLGILVSIVKLAKMANIIPGLSLYSFAVLIFVLAGAVASLDPHQVWDSLEGN